MIQCGKVATVFDIGEQLEIVGIKKEYCVIYPRKGFLRSASTVLEVLNPIRLGSCDVNKQGSYVVAADLGTHGFSVVEVRIVTCEFASRLLFESVYQRPSIGGDEIGLPLKER